MSDAGLRILTDTGNLQIDANYKNFVLKRKFKLSTMPQEYAVLFKTWTLAYTITLGANEMFFAVGCKDKTKKVRCYVAGIAIYQYNDEGASRWYREQESEDANKAYVYIDEYDVADPEDEESDENVIATASEIDVYVFGIDNAQVPSQGVGLAVYDENGNSVYFSNNKSMRVLHANYTGVHGYQEYTFDGNKDVAIVQTGTAYDWIVEQEVGHFDYDYYFTIDNIRSKIVPNSVYNVDDSDDSSFTVGQDWLFYILVDVTGY